MSATILTPLNFLAVGIGAVLGAWSRWLLALWLNPQPNAFPIGTFAANMIGAYLSGILVAWIASHPDWPPFVRLALITGFLGALTTFSSFSSETVTLIEEGVTPTALTYMATTLLGSLGLTVLGMLSFSGLKRLLG